MKDYLLLFPIFFVALMIFSFVNWARSTKWYKINNVYPLRRGQSEYENDHLVYGRINMCGYYRWHTGYSAIERDGIVIKKPFPFSLYAPPILIPWSEVNKIFITSDIEGRSRLKIMGKISPLKYAKIELKKFKDVLIVIPWRKRYLGNVPFEIIS
jgi:hypothetical protein